MKDIKAKPLSEEEIKELLRKSRAALSCMQTWRDCCAEKSGDDNDFIKMADSVINIFEELRDQWALAVGHPQRISRETLQEITEATCSILKQRLWKGTF